MRSPLRIALLTLVALVAGLLYATPAAAAPNFKAPYPCGQQWTYSHHSAEVRLALDFVRTDGGATAGTPVLASAAGTAYRYSQPSPAAPATTPPSTTAAAGRPTTSTSPRTPSPTGPRSPRASRSG